jgi:hypothetical protein
MGGEHLTRAFDTDGPAGERDEPALGAVLRPAARRWDQPVMAASHRRLLEIYRDHHAGINDLVARSEAETAAATEENAVVQMLILGSACLAVLVVLVSIGAAYLAFRRKVLWPIYITIETMRYMAAGDVDAGVTTEHRADEVKALISSSSVQVSRGVDLVGRSGDAFAAITRDISTLSEAIQSIATSAAVQAENLWQITTMVGELDRTTQQNAAMAEDRTAAATSLTREVSSLDAALAQFTVGTRSGYAAPAPLSRAA